MAKSEDGITTKRREMKRSGAKAIMHKRCQMQTSSVLRKVKKAARKGSQNLPVFKPPFAENEYLLEAVPDTRQVSLEEICAAMEQAVLGTAVCEACGKTVRVKKDGSLYKHTA